MLHLDHIAIFSQNFYEATFNVSKETGLGNYDGGFFPTSGVGIKVIPLGNDTFLEVEGMVDIAIEKAMADTPLGKSLFAKRVGFMGWAFRSESLEELEEVARLSGFGEVRTDVLDENGAQMMMNGEKVILPMAPPAFDSWPKGMPNVYYWPDMSKHDGRHPVEPRTGDGRTPLGIYWLEVGGTPADLEAWFKGMIKAKDYPLHFNGKAHGLYAAAINTTKGEVVIRRPSIFGDD